MNATSPAYRAAHTRTDDFESFLAAIKNNARSEAGAVIDQIRQRQAIMALDIPRELGVPLEQAARRVTPRC